jgi:crotonobetainyl-CoA:carnitine CoA-transferase CaiB-like acyl-CoA transferase
MALNTRVQKDHPGLNSRVRLDGPSASSGRSREGAGGNLNLTISSPLQVHDVTKVTAKRAPEIGEHNEQILRELGFNSEQIDGFHTSGTIADARHRELQSVGGAR